MSQITTHILDTTKGKPAAGVIIVLYSNTGDSWKELARGKTDDEGRIKNLLPEEKVLEKGTYKLHFETKAYFINQGVEAFYPFVEIVFEIQTAEHYHVPLLLNPYGFTTYRGS